MTKFSSAAMVVAIAGALTATAARAQTNGMRYYGAVTPTAYDNIEYYADDSGKSPSDKAPMPPAQSPETPMAPAAAAPAPAADSGAACTSCGSNSCGGGDCCKLTCPDQTVHRLFGDCCWLKCHDITVQGWAEAGYAWRDGTRNPDGFNGPDGFNDRDGEFLLDQFYTTIQKALKDNDCCWDWGFTVDLLYGSDYRFPLSKGLDARDDGTPKWHTDDRRLYGLALPQAYLEFGTKALSYKVGHFYTLLGNEVVPAIGNVFYSHTYTFLYAYPFTHTGALATYKPNDQLTLVAGLDEGWDNFDDTDENVGYTGQAIFTAKDKHTTLTYAWQFSNEPIVSGGNPTANPEARHGRFIESAVLGSRLERPHELRDRKQLRQPVGRRSGRWHRPLVRHRQLRDLQAELLLDRRGPHRMVPRRRRHPRGAGRRFRHPGQQQRRLGGWFRRQLLRHHVRLELPPERERPVPSGNSLRLVLRRPKRERQPAVSGRHVEPPVDLLDGHHLAVLNTGCGDPPPSTDAIGDRRDKLCRGDLFVLRSGFPAREAVTPPSRQTWSRPAGGTYCELP